MNSRRRTFGVPLLLRGNKRTLGRRRFITGLGGACMGLPWLESMGGEALAQAATGPRRVITVTYSMGVPLGQWRPGPDMGLPYVTEPLLPFVDRCLFVSAIDNSVLEAGGDSFVWGHPGKHEGSLTGTLMTGAFSAANDNRLDEVRPDAIAEGAANGPSVEHVIGEYLHAGHPLRSIDLGVDGDAVAEWGGRNPSQSSLFSYEGKGNPITLNLHPYAAFTSLFGGLDTDGAGAEDEALRRLRFRNKSVLDAVRASFSEIRVGLSTDDQRRLDEHAQRIRELELELQLTQSCQVPLGLDASSSYQGFRMDQLAPLQIRLLASAMGCSLAPVGRLEFTNQQNPRFGIESLDSTLDSVLGEYDWHGMVHGDPLPGTELYLRPGRDESVSEYDPRLLAGYRFFVEQFAGLLSALDSIPEGAERSVLDNSLVILASDLGEGHGHHHGKMGYILAGNLGGAPTGRHFDAGPARSGDSFDPVSADFYSRSHFNVNQLLNSILDMAGVTDGSSDAARIGLDGFLESLDAPRRIDDLFA